MERNSVISLEMYNSFFSLFFIISVNYLFCLPTRWRSKGDNSIALHGRRNNKSVLLLFFFSFFLAFFYTEYFFHQISFHLLSRWRKKWKIKQLIGRDLQFVRMQTFLFVFPQYTHTSIYSQNAKLLQNEERIILFDTFCFSSIYLLSELLFPFGLSFSIHFGLQKNNLPLTKLSKE